MTDIIDVEIDNQGTIVLFRPITKAGEAWIKENVQTEPWQWFGDGLCVEHRYAHDLADGMQRDGLKVGK